ncbi:phospholipid carrier-dependent glycosyltransferase [Cupriavidus pampae]|uniref:Undecaprenyl phosphate-alpha-4-amino-4-deoxy-L-arabinose arabinosyl transferase n=2 Tax=Cupriavidus pampae TaxID=659251 RepID=A0ABN7ZH96_9BURK|nr:Undecaprenyl phosphate-alpha-4-amino-4-deoxy-L-arabinose arabinosyl transferase [Cupriavidus pampae]
MAHPASTSDPAQSADLLSHPVPLSVPAARPWERVDRRTLWWIATAVAAVLVVWFGTLAMRHLIGPDEGRYAEISREMLATGDWVTIRYNALKYFEKPPFHMWVTAVAYAMFGVGEWQARLCVALSGLLGIGMTMLATWRWFGARAGWLAAIVLLGAPMWSTAAHFNTLDMTLAGAMSCTLATMLMAMHPDATVAERRRWMLACWATMGVAVLTKGLVGIALPGLVLVCYSLVARDGTLWRRLHWGAGLCVLLLVTVPWFWLIARRNPEFLHFFFIHEHWERYTSNVHSRSGPLLYFVPLIVGGMLPWAGLFPRMWRALRSGPTGTSFQTAGPQSVGPHSVRPNSARPHSFRPLLLAGVWAIAIFVFFSISRSKLPGYIVPVVPALAILAAVVLDRMDARAWRRQLTVAGAIAALCLMASPIVGSLTANNIPNLFYRTYAIWVAITFALMFAGVVLARWLAARERLTASMVTYGLAMYVAFTVALLGYDTVGRPLSGADIAPVVARKLTPEMPLYGVRTLDHTLPFYVRHPLTMVAEADELGFGVSVEPSRWMPTLAAFEAAWNDDGPALAVMSPDTYQQLAGKMPMYVVARDYKRVVVSNRP